VDRLIDLMRELLDYGKPQPLALAPGALTGVIALAIQACVPLAKQTQIEISNRVPTELAAILMDRQRLVQVFQNLLQNSIQHAPRGSAVTIEAEEVLLDGAQWVCCKILDSGPGLAEEDLERIFDPFFSKRHGGIGLGLAIVRRIVEEHRGEIAAANRPKGGAVMTVRLPVISDEARNVA